MRVSEGLNANAWDHLRINVLRREWWLNARIVPEVWKAASELDVLEAFRCCNAIIVASIFCKIILAGFLDYLSELLCLWFILRKHSSLFCHSILYYKNKHRALSTESLNVNFRLCVKRDCFSRFRLLSLSHRNVPTVFEYKTECLENIQLVDPLERDSLSYRRTSALQFVFGTPPDLSSIMFLCPNIRHR